MKIVLRAVVAASFVAAILVVGFAAKPTIATDVAEFWHVPEYGTRIRTAEEAFDELEKKSEIVGRRNALKQEALRDLLDGRLTFGEAVSRFAFINRTLAGSAHSARLYSGTTEEERAARQVIQYLRALHDPRARELAAAWDLILFSRVWSSSPMDCCAVCARWPARSPCRGPSESTDHRD
jgi:hypothetical protein